MNKSQNVLSSYVLVLVKYYNKFTKLDAVNSYSQNSKYTKCITYLNTSLEAVGYWHLKEPLLHIQEEMSYVLHQCNNMCV